MVLSQAAVMSYVDSFHRCPSNDAADDMFLGSVATALDWDVVHSPLFHQVSIVTSYTNRVSIGRNERCGWWSLLFPHQRKYLCWRINIYYSLNIQGGNPLIMTIILPLIFRPSLIAFRQKCWDSKRPSHFTAIDPKIPTRFIVIIYWNRL